MEFDRARFYGDIDVLQNAQWHLNIFSVTIPFSGLKDPAVFYARQEARVSGGLFR